jgi:hypothetical protein
MLRRKPQPAMVMTMKKTTSLNISVAESEAKLDASACHPLVGGEATTTLMARWLILAIYFRNLRIALFHKLSAEQAVKQPSTRIDQSTTYSSPHGISRSTYTDHTIIKVARLSIKQGKPEEFEEVKKLCMAMVYGENLKWVEKLSMAMVYGENLKWVEKLSMAMVYGETQWLNIWCEFVFLASTKTDLMARSYRFLHNYNLECSKLN